MPAFVTSAVDEQLAQMHQAIEDLKKTVEEKDLQIAKLMDRLEVQQVGESSEDLTHPPGFSHQKKKDEMTPQKSGAMQMMNQAMQSLSVGSVSLLVQQLQDMIEDTIRAQYGGPS